MEAGQELNANGEVCMFKKNFFCCRTFFVLHFIYSLKISDYT